MNRRTALKSLAALPLVPLAVKAPKEPFPPWVNYTDQNWPTGNGCAAYDDMPPMVTQLKDQAIDPASLSCRLCGRTKLEILRDRQGLSVRNEPCQCLLLGLSFWVTDS